jgi:DNA-binding Xre family transcriptional regulator
MPMRWKLQEFLEKHNITVYALAKETTIARNTLYNLTNKAPARIDLETLNELIPALERVTKKRVELTDLLDYERS